MYKKNKNKIKLNKTYSLDDLLHKIEDCHLHMYTVLLLYINTCYHII